MNILVTGGAGFNGSNLVHYLLTEAAAVTLVLTSPRSSPSTS